MNIFGRPARLFWLGAVVWAVFALFLFRLAQLQIVSGADYLAAQQRGSSRTQVVKAARGEILDRNGKPFAYNQASYNIYFDRALAPSGRDNATILRLIEMLRGTRDGWIDNLPMTIDRDGITFTEDADAVARLKKHLGTNSYASAQDVFYWLRDRYGLENLNEADARAVAGVRYEMERKGYSLSTRYLFAQDVALETAVLIRQQGDALPGVDVVEMAKRSYIDGGLAPHIVGRVGAIFPDELESYLSQDRGYARDDTVGKEGIEKAMESVLRGTDGVRRIDLDAAYNVVGIAEEKPAVPGSSVVLTIDKDIQRAAAEALVREIQWLNENAREGEGREADAGAVVAIDIKRSEVLAAVTYPSYNLESYLADYAQNSANPLHPFLNRALSGVYAPGSTFKPAVATAGLAEGVITPQTRVNCQHTYTFLPTYQPTCLGWHGPLTVTEALRASCNIFFYDTGRQLGIGRINRYAQALGLGVPTGIELSETSGTQCDPNSVNPGDALQAAIGQLDNGYSPLQLANYVATVARRGVRMDVSLVKSVSSYYDYNDVLQAHEPTVAQTLDVAPSLFDPIFDGMIQATHSPAGTAYRYLGDYPLTVASKTGTPQTKEFPNSTFICFAPAEDPQIAIAVVIEKGWHGYTGAPVARSVLDAFFFPGSADTAQQEEPLPGAAQVAAPAQEISSAASLPAGVTAP